MAPLKILIIGANGDAIFQRFMRAIGRDDLADDPSLADNAGRVARVVEIDAAIGAWAAQRTVDEVLAALDAAAVPAGRIYTVADIAKDPHYQARGMIEHVHMDDGTELAVPGITPKPPQCAGHRAGHRCGAAGDRPHARADPGAQGPGHRGRRLNRPASLPETHPHDPHLLQ